ncbi:MAG: mechanosensitive ion channel [Parvibaculaceae bacterium]
MENGGDILGLTALLSAAEGWVSDYLLTGPALVQAALLLVIFGVSYAAHRRLAPQVGRLADRGGRLPYLANPAAHAHFLVAPMVAMLLAWLSYAILTSLEQDGQIVRIAANLLTAWVVIRIVTGFLRQSGWASLIASLVWTVAALAILGWLDPIYTYLDGVAFTAGELRLSLLGIINGILLLGVFLLASNLLIGLADNRMKRLEGVSPAARVLFVKILRIAFIIIAFVVALTTVGIDLSAIAIFSGAVGIGVGFGLQKVISNLFSGILLLLDRSLKPGDVIEIGDAYGWINKMGARYITVATRDGKEYLIPNEDMITQQVINWSYSNRAVRIRVGVGISYGSDVRRAMELMVEAAQAQPRVLRGGQHDPQVRLTEFGDSSVNLELRIWVTDPEQGMVNVASDIRLAVWDAFHENGIEFPFPQRDLHLSSANGLEALLERYLDARGPQKT